MCHCADGRAPVARLLMSLQESMQRQGETEQSLGNEPETMAMRCCRGRKPLKHALTLRECLQRKTSHLSKLYESISLLAYICCHVVLLGFLSRWSGRW